MLFSGAEPEMAMLHEKRGRVLLGRDGIVLGDLEDLDILEAELKAARSALVLADAAADDERGFLGQIVEYS